MVINASRVRLKTYSVFIYLEVNVAVGARRINKSILPIVNYPQFILYQYQEVGQKPAYSATLQTILNRKGNVSQKNTILNSPYEIVYRCNDKMLVQR